MLKRLARKLLTLLVLCAALTAAAYAPASSAKGGPFCFREPDGTPDCPSGYWCCTGLGDCWCAGG
jgi:hypothetical protein